jgi:hypothetical protein
LLHTKSKEINERLREGMYEETSGRNGKYEPLEKIYFSLDNKKKKTFINKTI